MNGSGRIGRGWRLAKESWAVLRSDRSLTIFPLVAFFGVVASALVIAGPGVVLVATDAAPIAGYALWAVALYVTTFVGIYCSVALAAAASLALDGRQTTASDGFSVARRRTGVIAAWAAVQLTVGLVLNGIEAALAQSPIGRLAASIVEGLLSAAWGILTFFVVPQLALEGVGPVEALKRSARIIKERWGEALIGSGSIAGAIILIVLLPAVALGAGGVLLIPEQPVAGGVLLALGVLLLAAAILVGSTLNAIFRVALYRFATDGTVTGFSQDELEHAFRPRRRRGRI